MDDGWAILFLNTSYLLLCVFEVVPCVFMFTSLLIIYMRDHVEWADCWIAPQTDAKTQSSTQGFEHNKDGYFIDLVGTTTEEPGCPPESSLTRSDEPLIGLISP